MLAEKSRATANLHLVCLVKKIGWSRKPRHTLEKRDSASPRGRMSRWEKGPLFAPKPFTRHICLSKGERGESCRLVKLTNEGDKHPLSLHMEKLLDMQ